jgi:hypothetical protein
VAYILWDFDCFTGGGRVFIHFIGREEPLVLEGTSGLAELYTRFTSRYAESIWRPRRPPRSGPPQLHARDALIDI